MKSELWDSYLFPDGSADSDVLKQEIAYVWYVDYLLELAVPDAIKNDNYLTEIELSCWSTLFFLCAINLYNCAKSFTI